MEITPYNNGIHSLASGLRNLAEFLENGDDPYLMKEVIIKVHHGLETLFKDLLFQYNPVFILDDESSIKDILAYYQGFIKGKNNYLFDDAKTITPKETVKRLVSLKIIDGVRKKDLNQLVSSFDTLNSVINQIQHFAIKADPDSLVRVMGNLIPKSISLLKNRDSVSNTPPHQVRARVIPHYPIPGMENLFSKYRNIDTDLNSIFDKATEVIAELESRYDVLLNEAIGKFKSSVVNNLPINLKLKDHGHCGAPPYMPEITVQGWLNEAFSPHKNFRDNNYFFEREPILAIYEGSTIIGQPEVLERKSESPFTAQFKTQIKVGASISVLNPINFFVIPEYVEYIPFIKSPEINMTIDLECESEGIDDERNFEISRVKSLVGVLKFELNSRAYGDAEQGPSINGVQKITLNESNTSIRFHSFLESNRKLRESYLLDIGIDENADLVFS